ncbi:hypothetical protein SDC9_166331 [bioreactor metagenome]|uniref:Uncharacterized protein n=1 Tax=bioreactor metagenome TaxID=1076179 RepID=A0A645FYI2_9ZZZZ
MIPLPRRASAPKHSFSAVPEKRKPLCFLSSASSQARPCAPPLKWRKALYRFPLRPAEALNISSLFRLRRAALRFRICLRRFPRKTDHFYTIFRAFRLRLISRHTFFRLPEQGGKYIRVWKEIFLLRFLPPRRSRFQEYPPRVFCPLRTPRPQWFLSRPFSDLSCAYNRLKATRMPALSD